MDQWQEVDRSENALSLKLSLMSARAGDEKPGAMRKKRSARSSGWPAAAICVMSPAAAATAKSHSTFCTCMR
jgi:hypothetical protein